MPSVNQGVSSTLEAYKKLKSTKVRQTHVMIFPDLKSIASVVRSGFFDKNFGKIVLCSSASQLIEHGFDPIDIMCKGTLWQTTKVLGSSVNQSIAKSEFDDDDIQAITDIPLRTEHQHSNHKKEVKRITVADLENALGQKKSDIGIKALLKFIMFGFVRHLAVKAGSDANTIINACNKKLTSKNTAAFTSYIRSNKIPMTKEALDIAKAIQLTTTPILMLKFVWRLRQYKRPMSLAVAETACHADFAARCSEFIELEDVPFIETKSAHAAQTSSTSFLTVKVRPGMYTLVGVLKAIGADLNLVATAMSDDSIRINKKPIWKDGISWWPVKQGSPLLMILNKRRFKLEVESNG
jgi:hypothetical protein